MLIEYFHASRFGNGALVAAEFKDQMADRGVEVRVHHIREMDPRALPLADLYVFSSPGRLGKPLRAVRRLLRKVELPSGTRYAVLTTEMGPQPDRRTGNVPSEEEFAKWERVRPVMIELLDRKGLVLVAEDKVRVTAIKGPLENGWQASVRSFVDRVLASTGAARGPS
jgi:hypothetical protein